MNPFWHPLSALILPELGSFATPAALRMLVAAGGAEVLYAGDRMWPSVKHGRRVPLRPAGEKDPRPGDVVVALAEGIPDLLRVVGTSAGTLRLGGDADPRDVDVPRSAVVARSALEARPVPRVRRRTRRIGLDLLEAWRHGSDRAEDPSASVRLKYETQAPFYARDRARGVDPSLLERVGAVARRGGRIVVAGSGAGSECFALESAGWAVRGIDYAEAMVAAARTEARRRGSSVEFVRADLREHDEPAGSATAVIFTYDVYSFIPGRPQRIALLARMSRWLEPGGRVFVSARRAVTGYQRLVLAVQRLARRGAPGCGWGASHTRWIDPGGAVRRSFVQYFTSRALTQEAARAGFSVGRWEGGHAVLMAAGPGART